MKLFSLILLFALLPGVATVQSEDFPAPYNTEKSPGDPMSAAEAAVGFKVPSGFKATVFASEPDVQNPIGMAWDGRGRIWVAENYTYAERPTRFDLNLKDRLLIFEDSNGDGHFDKRTVFTDQIQMLTSVEVGLGGVWLMCPPRLLFIPDRNGDDKPDGPAEVVLDGFVPPAENYHNYANGLRFGPDGWLYGRCGASSPGEIGRPGCKPEERIPLRGTIWRYHPARKVFEALSCGTTNPWGHDWDEHGELFFINTVNGHLWHQIPGAHYVRPHTIDPNPRVYELIDQHADHWHFDTAQGWAKSRDGKADSFGGGHAHIGMMIYQGDNWPSEYRGHLFTVNMHGRRVNQEILERSGSGYVGHHGQDILQASDPWFRGMELSTGPDGGVYVLDWSDTGECHESTGVHRTSGRIYKVSYGNPARAQIPDFRQLDAAALGALQVTANAWIARQARLELSRRGVNEAELSALRKSFDSPKDTVSRLRLLWAINAAGGLGEDFLRKLLSDPDEHIRTWAIRFLTDRWPLDTVMSQRPANPDPAATAAIQSALTHRAASEKSGLVRLALASTLQRLPPAARPPLAAALVAHGEDASDHNLPLLIWYGLIPLADSEPSRLPNIAAACKLPLTRKFMARRLAEEMDARPEALNMLLKLSASNSPLFQTDILDGVLEAVRGWRKAKQPAAWTAFADAAARSPGLEAKIRSLNALFGDGRAIEEVRKIALDSNAHLDERKSALETLINSKPEDLREICEKLLGVQFLNSAAARGLARFDDPAVGVKLVRAYRQFHPSERPELMGILVSRASFAGALLDAMAHGKFSRADLSAFHARQLRSIGDAQLNKRLGEAWGELRENSKAALIAEWKRKMQPAIEQGAALPHGRELFNLACANCHTLHGTGGKVGPDLTGSARDNLDYLLENILDPSAMVSADFRMTVLALKDGRVLNGIVASKNNRTISLRTMTEMAVLELADVEKMEQSNLSLMPEGLLEGLAPQDARDLLAYLMQPAQVPLPGR